MQMCVCVQLYPYLDITVPIITNPISLSQTANSASSISSSHSQFVQTFLSIVVRFHLFNSDLSLCRCYLRCNKGNVYVSSHSLRNVGSKWTNTYIHTWFDTNLYFLWNYWKKIVIMIKYFQKVSFYSHYLIKKWNEKVGEGDNPCVVSLRAWRCKLI